MIQTPFCRLTSFRLPLYVSAVFLTAGTVWAQQAVTSPATSASDTASVERVIVTGSNIPTAEEVGPNPVLNFNRNVIERSPDRTTEEFLRNQPIANSNGVPVSNNENGSNTAVGAATIAL